MSRGHSRDTTQADVTNQTPAGKDRCPEIAAASASSVPSPACCDITCLPPHNHDESLWGSPPTASRSHRQTMSGNGKHHHAASLPLSSFFFCHDALISSFFSLSLPLSFSPTSRLSPVLGFCTLSTLSLF